MALPNTHHGAHEISMILENAKKKGCTKLFFDGIGGISMNSLAHISYLRGWQVSGYDRTPSDITAKLEKMGIEVFYTPSDEHIKDCAAVIYTVAMDSANPEYSFAHDHGIPLISRADYLGYIMTGYTERLGVSGTHGKSTTTGMLAKIFSSAGKKPTVSGGAKLKETGEVDIIGEHDFFVFEACEYMDSFLDFHPTIAIVLNIELDHVDYFKSIKQMRSSFTAFMNIPDCRAAVINFNDENCKLAAEGMNGMVVSFARNNPKADYYSANENISDGYPEFDIMSCGEILAHIKLAVPGEQNIDDALAAFASSLCAGLTAEETANGLSQYKGISRRLDKLASLSTGAEIYTDYAHHPTEIAVTLSAARKITKGKLKVIFQPHTYSRTAELFDDFVSAFASSEADDIILCPIYAAREDNVYGISSEKIAEEISKKIKTPVKAVPSLSSAAEAVLEGSENGDLILVMGAGDVINVAEKLASL